MGIALGHAPGCAPTSSSHGRKRVVLACSDLHIGYSAADSGDIDGEQWFASAINDIKSNVAPVDYAVVLGDIANDGELSEYQKYLSIRAQSGIAEWYELAGNHDYYGDNGIAEYRQYIDNDMTYGLIDGNLAWFFLSDEQNSTQGEISDSTAAWLKATILRYHRSHTIIVCSHQLVYGTVRDSAVADRCIYPLETVADILDSVQVDVWLAGHQHWYPWSLQDVFSTGRTAFINIASMTHAYGTGESQSFVLEFEQGSKILNAKRRVHDTASHDNTISIPLRIAADFEESLQRLRLNP